jgi:hypothetical protein
MEVAADGGGSYGVFAAAINANDGAMAAASTAAGQLRTMTAISPPPLSGKDAIAADAIASLPLHPTTASIDNDCRQQRPPLPRPHSQR